MSKLYSLLGSVLLIWATINGMDGFGIAELAPLCFSTYLEFTHPWLGQLYLAPLLGSFMIYGKAFSLGNQHTRGWIEFLARVGLASSYLFSAISKASDPLSFAQLVRAYEFLPLPFVNLYALTAPWAWILISFALILGPKTKLNTILYALVMLSFMIALGQASVRQLDITCGCFAIEGIEPSTSAALFRDIIFLIPVYWLWKNGTETWFWQLWSTRQIQKS